METMRNHRVTLEVRPPQPIALHCEALKTCSSLKRSYTPHTDATRHALRTSSLKTCSCCRLVIWIQKAVPLCESHCSMIICTGYRHTIVASATSNLSALTIPPTTRHCRQSSNHLQNAMVVSAMDILEISTKRECRMPLLDKKNLLAPVSIRDEVGVVKSRMLSFVKSGEL